MALQKHEHLNTMQVEMLFWIKKIEAGLLHHACYGIHPSALEQAICNLSKCSYLSLSQSESCMNFKYNVHGGPGLL